MYSPENLEVFYQNLSISHSKAIKTLRHCHFWRYLGPVVLNLALYSPYMNLKFLYIIRRKNYKDSRFDRECEDLDHNLLYLFAKLATFNCHSGGFKSGLS